MRKRTTGAALAFGTLLGLAAVAPTAAQQGAPAVQPDPNLNTEDQLAPSQIKQKVPAAVAEPSGTALAPTHRAPHVAAHAVVASSGPKGPHVVACSGVFGKDSSHLKLAMAFDYKNVTFADVEADGGTKVKASILFAANPKLRLEIWWTNPAERTGTYLIDIKDKSIWVAPGGMKLGLDLAALEKLNHKPFKLKGFDKNGVATVSDWEGGALAALPGGCKSGVSLIANPKASADAVGAITADKEFESSDSALRSVKPTVSEILIGY